MISEMPGTDIPAAAQKSKVDLSKLSTEDLKTLDRIYDKAKSGLPVEDGAGDKPTSGS